MCDPVTIGLIGLGASAVGTVMNNQAQQAQVKQYNQQAQKQNELLQKQFQDKQQKIQMAREGQAKVFKEMTDQQDQALAEQKASREERQKAFRESLQGDDLTTAKAAEQASMAQADQMYQDTSRPLPDASYMVKPTGMQSTEDRVVDTANAETSSQKSAMAQAIAKALAATSAMGAAGTSRASNYANVATKQNDFANLATSRNNILNANLRPLNYKMGAYSGVMGEEANNPYYRGVEPSLSQQPDMWSGLLQGAGSLGTTYAFMQPKVAGRKAKTAEVQT